MEKWRLSWSPLSCLMRALTSILFSFVFASIVFAQDIEIKLQNKNGEPIVNAHFQVYNQKDSIYGISDLDGIFHFEASNFPVKISVQHVAYLRKKLEIKAPIRILNLVLTDNNDQLNEVIITGRAQAILAKDAVKKVRVINRQRIDDLAAVNLKDLLSNELNIQISEDPILGSQLRIGGLDGQKIKILIDGVAVIGRLDGNIDLNQINLNSIERVEIVEGPMSVQYGTDAIAGTINLISKKNYNPNPEFLINSFTESVGRYNIDVGLNLPIKKAKMNLVAGRNFFQGYDLEEKRDLQWNPKEQIFTQFGIQQKFGKTLLAYSNSYFDEKISNRGEIGSIDSLVILLPDTSGAYKYPRALDDFYYTKRFDNIFRLQHFFNNDEVLKFHLAYNFFQRVKLSKIINLNTLESTDLGGIDAQDTSQFTTLNSRGFYENTSRKLNLKYQFGYEVNHETSNGERIVNEFQEILDLAVFSSLDFQLWDKLNVQPGLRYAYNSRFNSPLISSLALKYSRSDNWIFRASYGKGFRAPSLKELYFFFVDENHNILGNENLKAESSDNFQMNVDYSKKFSRWKLNIASSLFFNRIKNEIRLISVIEPNSSDARGLFTNRNVAESQSTGLNLSAKIEYGDWKTEVGTSLTGLKNDLSFSEDATAFNDNDFLFFPQYRFNISYYFKKIKMQSSLFINRTGARENLILNNQGELARIRFEGFTQSDFTLSKGFFKEKLKLTSGIKNLFDVTQIQSNTNTGGGAHSSGAGSFAFSYGRTYFLRIQLSF